MRTVSSVIVAGRVCSTRSNVVPHPVSVLSDVDKYAEDVRHTVLFLEGGSSVLRDELAEKMEQAARALDYEAAAIYRDQIASLSRVQERQYVSGETGDLDILACAVHAGSACVQVFFVRQGVNLGNKLFFPKLPRDSEAEDVLSAFVPQYYLTHPVPANILTSVKSVMKHPARTGIG